MVNPPMKMRPTSDHHRQKLKAATGRSLDRAGGGSVLAPQTRVEAPALSKYKAGHEETAFMPIDVALDCDMAAGAPIILTAMAAIQGYAVTPIDGDPQPLCHTLIGNLIRETGEVSAAALELLAAGKMTPAMRAAFGKEMDEALAALWQLRAAIRDEA